MKSLDGSGDKIPTLPPSSESYPLYTSEDLSHSLPFTPCPSNLYTHLWICLIPCFLPPAPSIKGSFL
jgi:hypothetical protein